MGKKKHKDKKDKKKDTKDQDPGVDEVDEVTDAAPKESVARRGRGVGGQPDRPRGHRPGGGFGDRGRSAAEDEEQGVPARAAPAAR